MLEILCIGKLLIKDDNTEECLLLPHMLRAVLVPYKLILSSWNYELIQPLKYLGEKLNRKVLMANFVRLTGEYINDFTIIR